LWKLYRQPDKNLNERELIDMELAPDETESLVRQFKDNIASSIQRWRAEQLIRRVKPQTTEIKDDDAPWRAICRNSLIKCVAWDVTLSALAKTFAYLLSLFYIFWI
jgi:hypothetical protein